MWYFIIIILVIIAVKWAEKATFQWETIIKHLWKGVYVYANLMAFDLTESEKLSMELHKAKIESRGKLINSILDYINSEREGDDENTEEETFGYGRYNFETILMLAKTNPKAFEKLK